MIDTAAAERLLDCCCAQAATAIDVEDYEAVQRFLDRGERLLCFIEPEPPEREDGQPG